MTATLGLRKLVPHMSPGESSVGGGHAAFLVDVFGLCRRPMFEAFPVGLSCGVAFGEDTAATAHQHRLGSLLWVFG